MASFARYIIVTAAFVCSVYSLSFDKWPKECEGQQICFTKPNRFPQPTKELIDKVLKTEAKTKEIVRVARDTSKAMEVSNDDQQQSKNQADESCPSITTHEKIYMVRSNVNKNWQYVVQNEEFQQTLSVTQCINENEPCSFKNFLINNVKSKCVTKYAEKSIVVYDPKTNDTDNNFIITYPVACACDLSTNTV